MKRRRHSPEQIIRLLQEGEKLLGEGQNIEEVARHSRRHARCRRSPGSGTERHVVVGRYYDPQTGQFLSVDPAVQQTSEAYLYARDDPVNARDTNGLFATNQCEAPGSNGKGDCQTPRGTARLFMFIAMTVGAVVIGAVTEGVGDAIIGELSEDAVAGEAEVTVNAAEEQPFDRVVIGKVADLKPENLMAGERTLLDQLPNLGSEDANWSQNERVLLQEMKSGNPIREATVDPNTGALSNSTGFLARERAVLIREGWNYDPTTHLWSPGR